MTDPHSAWTSATSGIADHVRQEGQHLLDAYRAHPKLVSEHVGIEDEILSGGYGHRQIHELIQNAADAIIESGTPGRVHLLLTEDALYCANEGSPIDVEGIDAILNSHMSRKRGSQIGQFGLGFKSVLAISTRPEFYCRSGSFAFDADWSAERIRHVLPTVGQTPVLRLARPISLSEVGHDARISEFMEWATTVIKLPRNIDGTEWLSEDLDSFPPEFLLFSPHVRLLTMDDQVTGLRREIATTHHGSLVSISEAGENATWSVFEREISFDTLKAEARRDATGKTRDRSSLPLLWAVPHEGRRARGQFWAFFPTETETSLTGILNAPWKTNADRQNLLDGPFNHALLDEAVRLIADSLPELFRESDPGFVLDVLPARHEDAAGWADAALIKALERELAATPCVPDVNARLRKPVPMRMRPDVVTSPRVAGLLSDHGDALSDAWVHGSVEKRERRAKAERLGVTKAPAREWLEALAQPASPASSIRAIVAAGVLAESLPTGEAFALRQANVILTQFGVLVNADQPALFLPHEGGLDEDGHAVHRLVAADPMAREVLARFKVAEQSAGALLDALLRGFSVDWEQAWIYLHQLPVADALAAVQRHAHRHQLFVRTRAGDYKPLSFTLLEGSIVSSTGARDAGVCIDPIFHDPDAALLRVFGATDSPRPNQNPERASWYETYLREARRQFLEALPPGRNKPSWDYLVFDHDVTVGPMDPLTMLSSEGRTEMTRALLAYLHAETPWELRHSTQRGAHATLKWTPPVRWMVQRHGRLETSLGARSIKQSVGSSLAEWHAVLPVADVDPPTSTLLQLASSLGALTEAHWATAFDQIEHVADDTIVGRFYASAAQVVAPPRVLWCRRGDDIVALEPPEIHVACDAHAIASHRAAEIPFVQVPDRLGLELLVNRWGMQKAGGTVHFVAASDYSPLGDALPGLRRYLPESTWQTPIQPCEQIWFEDARGTLGTATLTFARVGDRLCFTAALAPIDLLARVAADLRVALSDRQLQDALNYARREERQHLVGVVRAIGDVAGKLAALIGVPALLHGLPAGVQAVLATRNEHGSGQHVAQAAMAVHGVDVLRHHAEVLASAGLEPPSRWNGSARAQEFVDELGFPPEYAGFRRGRREPALDVDGPTVLNPLHEFQKAIGSRIQEFLRRPTPERGLVSLPTGSGKTRVVVQAFVESIERGEFDGSIVWIAQSDELCEQAVQSWAQVWRALGPRRRLRISRLWGETNNRIVHADHPHVVVATYHSLVTRLRSPAYRWLADASCVIIDEAHGSIAPSYTEILEQFGLTAHRIERPLVGLTATPFRSAADPAETQWLVNRYGKQRFDHGVIEGDDPYPVLQNMGVLARVDQQILEGNDLQLSPSELEELIQFKRVPASVEARLGESAPRNQRIIDSIKALPDDWPILLFATSVEQAHLMAALLSVEGVSAKAISGETDQGARRHYIEEFRRGRIRVLSNYNVLSTGFDAPALRALYIARPVYSPVLYQQMLGRGLRGPLNGGKDRCLVVNVADNIAQFGEQLAFRHFEYLWTGDSRT